VIAFAILLAVQAIPQELLARADEANGAYVQCLFAESRAANAARLGVVEFERKLAGSCTAEEEAVVRTGIAILRLKGVANPAASARQQARDARRSVVETYRTTLKFRP
jgi:hypothetical protein